ncbi:hypothetical protein HHK36_000482 [Tetracentron sinense]|uniref:Retroviral polymerase SH3-like domain-containing protein n=1 Tax=Tetracentron sinense TaxID=13715 RepID=A0A834ZR48_TETSI|nr:hypothetical protein HHK36_000482 [Tetracentron sinense]
MSRRQKYIPFLILPSKAKLILRYPPSKTTLSTSIEKSLVAHYSSSILSLHSPAKIDFVKPDEYALAYAIKGASSNSPNDGKQIHTVVVKFGFCHFTILMTALTNFNLKCGCLEEARRLFDEMPERDVVTWTSMIVGYAQHQHYAKSLELFHKMSVTDAIPNGYSFSGALSACGGLQALRQGQQIHAHVLTSGILGESIVLQNNLLNMYSRCQSVGCACKLFDSMATKRIIAWNEMISGHLQCEQREEALKLFASMVSSGVKPDNFSYAICTDVCADLASLKQGSQIHACILKSGFQLDLIIGNALVDMYAKCGCIDSAKLVFDSMPFKDTLIWTTMISAFGKHSRFKEVLTMFEQMPGLNIRRDGITYLTVLWACSHGGMVNQGLDYFESMTKEDLISAGPEHYACMVDLLCRSGHLPQALEFIKMMPLKPSVGLWSAFLNSCRLYRNIELAQLAAGQLLELNREDPSKFVVLSSIYAAEHDWNKTEKLREGMRSANMKKEPGCSWVELKNGVHVFLTADRSNPEMCDILLTLNSTDTGIVAGVCINGGFENGTGIGIGSLLFALGKDLKTANGESLPITAVGDISPSPPLQNVFYSPSLSANLISIGRLVDNDCDVSFSRSGCIVKDQVSGKIIVTGPKCGRLFPLRLPTSPRKRNKLTAQSVKSAFLGIAPNQKGFLCYDPLNHKLRTSWNVVFLENQYFFQLHMESSSLPLMSLLPDFSDDESPSLPTSRFTPGFVYERRRRPNESTNGTCHDSTSAPASDIVPQPLRRNVVHGSDSPENDK